MVSPKRQYWHGGPAGRQRGALLLPPAITSAPSSSEFGAGEVHRRDRVYLTTTYSAAVLFAAGHRRGVVYRCEPIGELEPDPDYHGRPGGSVQCERARVLRVIKPDKRDLAIARHALLTPETA